MIEEKLISEGISLGIKAVKTLFDLAKKQDKDLISIGLAVGYFYNFLDPVSSVIRNDELELRSDQFSSGSKLFNAESVKVQILIPSRLDIHAFQSCEAEFKDYDKGEIYLKQNKRFYGVNYSVQTMAKKETLIITDVARPLMAVKRYYEEILKIDTHDKVKSKWLKTQASEIEAFKETLRLLQERGYGVLPNKIDFQERG